MVVEDGCREGGHPLKWQRGRERGELHRTGRECLRRTGSGKDGMGQWDWRENIVWGRGVMGQWEGRKKIDSGSGVKEDETWWEES